MKSIGSLGHWGSAARERVVAAASLLAMSAVAITLMVSASAARAEPTLGGALTAPTPAVATTTSVTLAPLSPATPVPAPTVARPSSALVVDFRGEPASPEARAMARAAFERADAKGLPFAVVDKKAAKLFVFLADGRLAGAAPALLGLARGDRVAPGVGDMVATGIPADLRTTPAGRYDSQPGPNLKGETVIWVDYDAAFAIHRLRPSPARERRAERLASPSPDDNRISLGCVVVTGEFFDRVVAPVLGHGAGVVYVLPEPAPAPLAQGDATRQL
ncbi:hypothetical protein SAMN05428960_2818 [Mitsuaria sp. PDC51]|mgnify:CR=1 FL=1|nr:hypothetical protein SAMN05428960_2818 [Mitsuaria sp. PDC51]